MQQRRLRLGDILDDYCPRERRITNHAVVAMIEDQVKQTRCTTCDADHEYKEAKTPPPRRKKTSGVLESTDSSGEGRPVLTAPMAAREESLADGDLDPDLEPMDAAEPSPEPLMASGDTPVEDEEPLEPSADFEDDGPVHRRLIRATLPRPEGQVPERKEPDFTMRQPTSRFNPRNARNGQGHRGGTGHGGHSGGGHRPMRAGQGNNSGGPQGRFGGPRHGAGQGGGQGQQRNGNRPGQPPSGQRGAGRPGGQNRGQGRKRGR